VRVRVVRVDSEEEYRLIGSWLWSAERIAHSALITGTGILGFTSPNGSAGVSALTRLVAEILVRSGLRVMLVDFNTPTVYLETSPSGSFDSHNPWQYSSGENGGYTILTAKPTFETRFLFNNVSWLRQRLGEEKEAASILIADLPPVIPNRSDILNVIGPASACDAVLLVCPRGRMTRSQLVKAMSVLRAAAVNVVGTVLNDVDYLTPGEELAPQARSFFRRTPILARWMEKRVRASRLLR